MNYSIFFDIEDFTNYEEDNIVEGFQVDLQNWCDTDGMLQYAREHGINIGSPVSCLKADGDITIPGELTGDVLSDFTYNISDEYAIPINNTQGYYTNALLFLNGELLIRDAENEEIDFVHFFVSDSVESMIISSAPYVFYWNTKGLDDGD